ncbi:MAG: pseudouridine synthase [Lachnospiraceae bacterium]|nr:pseudouridine synthase [Lachnospiraceae bacterium]
MRLNRYLASCGIGSRREADRLIGEGLVTVNGAAAAPGMQVTGAEDIRVRGKALQGEEKKVVVAWYKPVGVTTTERDPHAKRTVAEAFSYPIRLTYAGRLDRDSEGLLLMTNDGDLIEAMMRGSSGHEKEYVVRTRQKISDAQLKEMAQGIYLKDLQVKTRPCRITRLGDCSFRIVLTQGLNRQIRRMCHAVGLEVKMLKRVRVLNVTLSGLQPGMQRKIDGKERSDLYQAAGLTPPQ